MFCDLVGSTALSARLDPEEYQAVVQTYQATCTAIIEPYAGHIAQHLGDGLLVYFGYPNAHEDDAQRAVRAGLEIVAALPRQIPSPLAGAPLFSPSPCQGEGSASEASAGEGSGIVQSQDTPHPNLLPQGEKELRRLQVRIGIHTGPVVVSEIGSGEKREVLALGETPNLAARVQGQAAPNEVVVSAATFRLIHGLFETEDRGPRELIGAVYRRARELCRHVGETPQLFPVLWGLWAVYVAQAKYQTALELGEQCLCLAQNVQDPALLVEAPYALECTLAHQGEALLAREHFDQVITLYNPHQHRSLAFLYGGLDPEVLGRSCAAAWFLWFLGYPEQALMQSHEALTLAPGIVSPF